MKDRFRGPHVVFEDGSATRVEYYNILYVAMSVYEQTSDGIVHFLEAGGTPFGDRTRVDRRTGQGRFLCSILGSTPDEVETIMKERGEDYRAHGFQPTPTQ